MDMDYLKILITVPGSGNLSHVDLELMFLLYQSHDF